MPEGIEPEFCTWAEVCAVPENNDNPFLKNIKPGDLVAYLHFAKDAVTHPDTHEEFLVLEVEGQATGLKGQVIAILRQ
jgi:hypothetical protein